MQAARITLALVFLTACGSSGSGSSPAPDAGTGPDGSVVPPGPPPPPPPSDGGVDPVVSTFTFIGCNRLQGSNWNQTDNPSSANLPQLKQTFADIVALPTTPKHLFFTGDLVIGLRSDVQKWLKPELDSWAAEWKGDPIAAKVPLVPMVGNHEVLADDVGNGTEAPNPASHAVWNAWTAANGWDTHAGNGPTNAPPNADALNDDQSRMSYSFDDGDTHFVLLNTDTWTASNELGWVALSWLEADLAAAQANANVARVFVFGHKPVLAPSGSTSAFEAVNAKLATKMIQALDASAKVKGYFAAHAHQWSARKLPGARGVYQIVAGNGGSMPDGSFKPGFYGFTEARIHASGKIAVVSHERPIPNPYYAGPATAAVPQAELVIAP